MRSQVYLGRSLPLLCLLAAVGPSRSIIALIRARHVAPTIKQYGPLPEIHVTTLDYITLVFAGILLIAGVLELARFRFAAPIAFSATMVIWAFYVPTLWDDIRGSTQFVDLLGRYLGVSWQMLVYQSAAMVCSGALTYIRFARKRVTQMNVKH